MSTTVRREDLRNLALPLSNKPLVHPKVAALVFEVEAD